MDTETSGVDMAAGYNSSGGQPPYLTQVREAQDGQIVTILGHANGMSTTTQTVWNHASISVHQFSAVTIDVASTDINDTGGGSGALTILMIGLGAAGEPQQEVIALTGQTEVASILTYTAVNNLILLTAGAGKRNAGDIWAGNGTFTSGVPATKYFVMDAGFGRGTTMTYTVPAGKVLIPVQTVVNFGASSKDLELRYHQDDGALEQVIFDVDMPEGDFSFDIQGGIFIGPRKTITVEGEVSTGSGNVTILFIGRLADA